MAASTVAAPVDGPDCPSDSGQPISSPQFTTFTLAPGKPLAQTALQQPNPLCRLAARTSRGRDVCEQGCGLSDLSAVAHTCPFGMALRRVGELSSAGGQWLGRRFASVGALHDALDYLTDCGFDEETILAHLPPNPIAYPQELDAAVQAAMGEAMNPAVAPVPAGFQTSVGDMFEYLVQMQTLLQTALSRETACERFLRALAGLVPFTGMEIYLPDAEADGLVIAAAIQGPGSAPEKLERQICRLATGALGAEAFCRALVLAKAVDETSEEFIPNCRQTSLPGMLALPLLASDGQPFGVWLVMQPTGKIPAIAGGEWFRFMTIMSRSLATALERLELLSLNAELKKGYETSGQPPARVVALAENRVQDAFAGEFARAQRQGFNLALLTLDLISGKKASAAGLKGLNLEHLHLDLAKHLRPYDVLRPIGRARGFIFRWQALIPGADQATVQNVAARLLALIEDGLDAQGGMEELGLSSVAGAAMLDASMSNASALEQASVTAATQAAAMKTPGALSIFQVTKASVHAQAASG